MDILKISNSCINCDNLNHELKRCGIHEVEVSENILVQNSELIPLNF